MNSSNKTFWLIIEPYLNEKGLGSDKITLSGNESVLTSQKKKKNRKWYEQLLYKHHEAFKLKASYRIQYNGHRPDKLNF